MAQTRKLALAAALLLLWGGSAPAQLNSSAYPSAVLTDSQATLQTNETDFPSTRTLASGITATGTSITLNNGNSLRTPGVITIQSEHIKIASRAGAVLTVWTASLTVSTCSNATPIQVDFTTDHGLTGAERITITGVTGNTACNVSANAFAVVDADSITLTGTAGDGSYLSGGAATATGRGFDGSTPASHSSGVSVRAFAVAHQYHQLLQETQAIETLLGTDGDNVGELAEANTWTAKQTFDPTATTAAARILCDALPSSPATGDMACDSGASNAFKIYNGSAWVAAGGLADPGSNGLLSRTALNTTVARTLTAPAAGISVADGDGVSGNPTLSLANDLAALEALASTGFAVRSGSDTWVQRSIAVGTGLSVSNGDGVSGNPTISPDLTADFAWTGYHNFSGGEARWPETTVGSLPAAASNTGKVFVVTDADDATDCSSGSGSAVAICRSDGSSYEALGGDGGLLASSSPTWTGSHDFSAATWKVSETVVGSLPAASGVSGRTYLVTDGSAVGDCSVGSGTAKVWCRSNGSSWECAGNCGGASSGLGDPGANGIVARTSAGVTAARTITGGNGVTVTNGNGVSGNPTLAVGRYFTKSTIDTSDLNDADTSEDETLFTAGQYEKICGVTIKHSTAFSGGSVSALTASVGWASDPDIYATAFDVFQATGDTVFQDSLIWRSATMAAAGHDVIARFTSTGDSLDQLSAGAVDIWVCREAVE